MFDLSHINLWAVLVAAIVEMAIGFIWYQKMVFGKAWGDLSGKSMEQMSGNPAMYLVNLVVYLVMAFVLAQTIFFFGATTLMAGVGLGLFMWVGLIAPVSIIENLFAQRSWKLYLINYGYSLVSLAVMGAILAVWR